MADINPEEILNDLDLWLPTTNVLTCDQLTSIINKQIAAVGTDESYYAEVFCKSLTYAAEVNKAKSSKGTNLKSRKLEDLIEEEYFKSGETGSWSDFIVQLPGICSSEGYTDLGGIDTGYILVSPGTTIDVNNTSSTYL